MGLLGNVAEVPDLRQKLMTKAFVAEFAMLLDSRLDGIEVRRKRVVIRCGWGDFLRRVAGVP